jgi:hypothetical protein
MHPQRSDFAAAETGVREHPDQRLVRSTASAKLRNLLVSQESLLHPTILDNGTPSATFRTIRPSLTAAAHSHAELRACTR